MLSIGEPVTTSPEHAFVCMPAVKPPAKDEENVS
jgi:hypothetical protein